jgi:hypothetical protein
MHLLLIKMDKTKKTVRYMFIISHEFNSILRHIFPSDRGNNIAGPGQLFNRYPLQITDVFYGRHTNPVCVNFTLANEHMTHAKNRIQ